MIEVVIDKPGAPPLTYRLRGGVYGIGRQDDNEIVLDDKEVSRHHARLLVDGDVVVVMDLGSGNGTFVEGIPVQDAPLAHGGVVDIVPFRLHVRTAEVAEESADAWVEGVDGPLRGVRIPLEGEAISVGRGEDQDMILPDPGASRSHAMFVRRSDGWTIRDNGSANGLLVNDQPMSEAPLCSGDVVRIGSTRLRFVEGREGYRDDEGLDLEEATIEANAASYLSHTPGMTGPRVVPSNMSVPAHEAPAVPTAPGDEVPWAIVAITVGAAFLACVVLVLLASWPAG